MPTIFQTTVQSTLLKVSANIVAQVASRVKDNEPVSIDFERAALFAAVGLVVTPLNALWQEWLEYLFPSQHYVETQHPATDGNGPVAKLDWKNILTKLIIDQTIGTAWISASFLIVTKWPRCESTLLLLAEIRTNIWTLVKASWTVWPWVALVNFIFIPVSWRVLVGSLVGFGWNIFLSIMSTRM